MACIPCSSQGEPVQKSARPAVPIGNPIGAVAIPLKRRRSVRLICCYRRASAPKDSARDIVATCSLHGDVGFSLPYSPSDGGECKSIATTIPRQKLPMVKKITQKFQIVP